MRIPAALSATLAGLLLAQLAAAQSPDGAAPSAPAAPAPAAAPAATGTPKPALDIVPAEPDQPALEPIPSAHDNLAGHFQLGAGAGAKWPFGSHSGALATGLGLNLDLGFGISRYVVLGLWGEYDTYHTHSACGDCSGSSFAGGPLVRYHVVQGTRFDPWGELAVGMRSTKVDIHGDSKTHTGPDFLKLTLGGDWYFTSNVALGPYVTFDLGTYGTSSHSGLGTGLRLVLDLPGK
ncbi:MAG: hypothetical protein ABUL62_31285 [Myxococcales bacterium]